VKSPKPRRILVLGATGTIGRATVRELLSREYEVVCFGRSEVEGAEFRGERFDAVVSCMASRSGLPGDAWAVDYQAHLNVLEAAQKAGVKQFVLLSAICVQKPVLAFQQAKLAFEAKLMASGLTYSIVRPTAYFKSLSGQVARVQKGKPFLLFGDGRLTACKPISDRDLAAYLANCLDDPKLQNAILPIGGPGPAMTPREQGEHLFALLGLKPKFKQVPVVMMSAIIRVLSILGFKDKAELARIGRYYATESMLVWDPVKKRYDADATPSFGTDRLSEFHAKLISGEESVNLGEHAVF
jgi:divinyl chlorophyllide a 8-vinyl-reductase